MDVAVVGAGWIGTYLSQVNGWDLVRGDILNPDFDLYVAQNYQAVVNAAGKTGRPNVDWCETHREETRQANVLGPCMLQDACAKTGAKFVHLGSGCLWQLESGVQEETTPAPPSYYGHTKAMADALLMEARQDALIVRLRMPIHHVPNPRNLITKVLGYREIISTPNSVTELGLLALVLDELIEQEIVGLFNVANRGMTSPWEIIQAFGLESERVRISLSKLETMTRAIRSNCTLDVSKVEHVLGWKMPEINIPMMVEMYKESIEWSNLGAM